MPSTLLDRKPLHEMLARSVRRHRSPLTPASSWALIHSSVASSLAPARKFRALGSSTAARVFRSRPARLGLGRLPAMAVSEHRLGSPSFVVRSGSEVRRDRLTQRLQPSDQRSFSPRPAGWRSASAAPRRHPTTARATTVRLVMRWPSSAWWRRLALGGAGLALQAAGTGRESGSWKRPSQSPSPGWPPPNVMWSAPSSHSSARWPFCWRSGRPSKTLAR